jgi:hypothetical protein
MASAQQQKTAAEWKSGPRGPQAGFLLIAIIKIIKKISIRTESSCRSALASQAENYPENRSLRIDA